MEEGALGAGDGEGATDGAGGAAALNRLKEEPATGPVRSVEPGPIGHHQPVHGEFERPQRVPNDCQTGGRAAGAAETAAELLGEQLSRQVVALSQRFPHHLGHRLR